MSAEPKQLALLILSGLDSGEIFLLGSEALLGCKSHCDIELKDPGIASTHLSIRMRGGLYTITDLTDDADVSVNGRVVKSRRLSKGDKIKIGSTMLQLVDPDEAMAAEVRKEEEARGTEKKEPEPGVLVVSTEDRPSTKIFRPGVEVIRQEEVLQESGHIRTIRMPSEKRQRSSAYQSARLQEEESSGSKVVVITVLLLIVGIVVGVFALHRNSIKRGIEIRSGGAIRYVEGHQEDFDGGLKKLQEARNEAVGKHSGMTYLLDVEIRSLESRRAEENKRIATILEGLDVEAEALAAEHRYEEAVNLYDVSNKKDREKIRTLRTAVIVGLRKESVIYKAEQERQIEELQAEKEKKARDLLVGSLENAVRAMIGGRSPDAQKYIQDFLASDSAEFLKDLETKSLESAIMTIKLLHSVDRKLELDDGAGVVDTSTLSPIILCVLAIRKNEMLTARANLDKDKDNILHDYLLKHASISDDDLKQEKAAAKTFAILLGRITGEKVTKIPRPADCIIIIRKSLSSKGKEVVAESGEQLKDCQNKYSQTKFVESYAAVFAAADSLESGTVEDASGASGIGDGRIIQVEEDTYYVEMKKVASRVSTAVIALFDERTVYLSAGVDKKPLAVLADIHTVAPYKVLGDNQIMFNLPEESVAEPKAGDYVLVGKNLKEGTRLLFSTEYTAAGSEIEQAKTKVMGIDSTGKKILVLAGLGIFSSPLPRGRPVYFFKAGEDGKMTRLAVARLEGTLGKFLLCTVTEGEGVDGDSAVRLSSKTDEGL